MPPRGYLARSGDILSCYKGVGLTPECPPMPRTARPQKGVGLVCQAESPWHNSTCAEVIDPLVRFLLHVVACSRWNHLALDS